MNRGGDSAGRFTAIKRLPFFRTSFRRRVFAFFMACIVIELVLRYDEQEGLHVWGLPYRIYGYLRLDEPCYPPGQTEKVEKLKGMFFDFVDIAESVKMRYWIDFGALLGAVRDGKIIPWDWDIDIGVMKDEMEADQVQKLLKGKGFYSDYKGACKYWIYQGDNITHLDVYMHLLRKEDDMVIRCEIQDISRYQFPAKWIMPTSTIEFEGRMVQAPNPPIVLIKNVRYPYSYKIEIPQNFYCFFTKWKYFAVLVVFVLVVILPVVALVYCCCKML